MRRLWAGYLVNMKFQQRKKAIFKYDLIHILIYPYRKGSDNEQPPKVNEQNQNLFLFSVSEHVFEIYIKDRKLIKYKNKDCK